MRVPERLERDAAAGFELRAPADLRHGRAQCVRSMLSSRQPLRARLERLGDLLGVAAFDLEREIGSSGAASRTASPTPPAIAAWFSFIRIAS